jgi:hypothetical protein
MNRSMTCAFGVDTRLLVSVATLCELELPDAQYIHARHIHLG